MNPEFSQKLESYILPFSAVVGQDRMKRALLVNAINPRIGGLLIMGGRGSAKSTAARALARLLPTIQVPAGCPLVCDPEAPEAWCPVCTSRGTNLGTEARLTPFVSLPLGATQESVVGTLDLEEAVTKGKKRWEPGLLARAHRGLLYIDEVNLLPDHLVDLLLDVAASSINTVEREGISLSHPARFILIGTMNPDEGDLRPQLLDRFGLCVEAEAIQDPEQRAEVVARILAFEADPAKFWARWEDAERALRQRLLAARDLLPAARVPERLVRAISELCWRENVEGLRADILIQKTSLALAAWDGRDVVNDDYVEEAAAFALLHRRRPGAPTPPSTFPQRQSPDAQPFDETKGQGAESGQSSEGAPPSQNQPPSGIRHPVLLPEEEAKPKRGQGTLGRHRDRRPTSLSSGPMTGYEMPNEHPIRVLALVATLRVAAGRQAAMGFRTDRVPRITVRPEDLRVPIRQALSERLYLFALDASSSMAAKRRMEATKSLLIGLLESAYRKRDRVALVAFAGRDVRLLLPPTRSVRRAQRLLHDLPVGGRTPMAAALRQVAAMALRVQRNARDLQQVIVVVSDGRGNVASPGIDPLEAVTREFARLAHEEVPVVLLDAEEGPVRLGLMRTWAKQFGFVWVRLADLQSQPGARGIRKMIQAAAS